MSKGNGTPPAPKPLAKPAAKTKMPIPPKSARSAAMAPDPKQAPMPAKKAPPPPKKRSSVKKRGK